MKARSRVSPPKNKIPINSMNKLLYLVVGLLAAGATGAQTAAQSAPAWEWAGWGGGGLPEQVRSDEVTVLAYEQWSIAATASRCR